MPELCESCGFVWNDVAEQDIKPRILAAAAEAAQRLLTNSQLALQRPESSRWSMLEYGAHMRDVLLHVRDRFVIGVVEDNPEFKPLFREQRVDLGLYADDTSELVADELNMAAALFVRTFEQLSSEQLARPCQYAYPTLQTRTLLWMGQQVVHEIEHHASDVTDNLRQLSGSS